jgi:hypothetical protein
LTASIELKLMSGQERTRERSRKTEYGKCD